MDLSVKRRSAFWGEIEEIPNIYVDNFKNKNQMAYFLSHNHFDGSKGLFRQIRSYILQNNGAKIYMSEETKKLLTISHWYYDEAKLCDIVEPLKVGMTYTIDLPDGQSFQVTMIPVTHMPGAVMFLFRTKEKTILYTGDFVIEEDKINELTKLHNKNGSPLSIDTMYVDAHFDNDDYRHFPSRSLCHSEVVNEIQNWLKEDNREVALFHHYPFGYEDIHKEIKKALGIRLFARNIQTLNSYRALYGDATVLTDNSSSKIHICMNRLTQTTHWGCNVIHSDDIKYLHIFISAQRGCYYDPERDSPIYKETDESLYLCYPTHCSKSQLDAFINYFRPKRTVKFPVFPVRTSDANTPFKKESNHRGVGYRDDNVT